MPFGTTFEQDPRLYEDGLDKQALPAFDALGSIAKDAWVHNPMNEISAFGELGRASEPKLRSPAQQQAVAPEQDRFLDPADLNKQYGEELGLSFDKPTRAGAVDIIVRRKREEKTRDAYIARSPGGFWFGAASFATQLAVSAVDPLNIASAFVPVVSEARAGLWAARYGKTVARAAQGAVEGAVGSLLVEPTVYGTEKAYQGDYDLTDSFLNVAVGTALGGGLHVGFGKISDMLSRAAPETREAALRASVANMAEGRAVDIQHVLVTDPVFQASNLPVIAEDFRLHAEDLGLRQQAAGLEGKIAALGQVDQTPIERLHELRTLEAKMADAATTPEEKRALSRQRDEMLANVTPEELQAQAGLAEARNKLRDQHQSDSVRATDRMQEIKTRREQIAADAVLGPHVEQFAQIRDAIASNPDLRAIGENAGPQSRLVAFAQRLEADSRVQGEQGARVALDQARTGTEAFARGQSLSTAASPSAAASAERTVKEGLGDDLEAELKDANQRLAEYERQGALTADDLSQVERGKELLATATKQGKAADAAARCLLLHP